MIYTVLFSNGWVFNGRRGWGLHKTLGKAQRVAAGRTDRPTVVRTIVHR